jgi:hypothetical protein
MVVEDPVVLGADEARDGGRRHPLEHRLALESDQREVVEQRLVVPELLVDMELEVARERRRDGIGAVQLACPLQGGTRQRDGRADDLVLNDQVLGPELGDERVVDEASARLRVRRDDELERAPEAAARAGLKRLRQWSANAFIW